MDERKVKRIYHPPTVPAADLFKEGKQRRVAAYARVSTTSDEQLNSVEAQKDYFDKLIRQRPDWIFVDVYADEGITGTSINRRGRIPVDIRKCKVGPAETVRRWEIFRAL